MTPTVLDLDGAVIGSRAFADEVFAACRDRFGPRRSSAHGQLVWSMRDLPKGVG